MSIPTIRIECTCPDHHCKGVLVLTSAFGGFWCVIDTPARHVSLNVDEHGKEQLRQWLATN